MTSNHRPDEEKRGGYSGSTDAEQVPPPARLPSGSIPVSRVQTPK